MVDSTWNLRRFNPDNINPSTGSSGVIRLAKSYESAAAAAVVSHLMMIMTPIIKVEGITGRIILEPQSTFASMAVIHRLLQCSSHPPE